jgi:3-oxoacyl-[acyl-carrier protein] reductase
VVPPLLAVGTARTRRFNVRRAYIQAEARSKPAPAYPNPALAASEEQVVDDRHDVDRLALDGLGRRPGRLDLGRGRRRRGRHAREPAATQPYPSGHGRHENRGDAQKRAQAGHIGDLTACTASTLAAVDLGLNEKVALVTGGSRGIGLGIARALAAEGARVALSSRTPERVETVAGEIGARPYVHDMVDLDAAPDLVRRVEEDLGPLDILVTNTGGPPGADPLACTREQWEQAHRELVVAPMELIGQVVPGMRERGFGRVLNVASSTVREPSPALILSNSHRPGIVAAFKTLSRAFASDGVTFNSLLPGRIATDRLTELYGSLDAAEEVAREQVPAARLGTPEEMGAAAAFLCSERAAYITGVTLLVDGGLTQGV